jgi:hypothetical protein
MADSFNPKRFWVALRSHLQDGYKDILRNFLIMLCYLLAMQLFFIIYLAMGNAYTYILEVTVTYSAATCIFVIIYGASCIMGPEKPARRTAFVALQATALEKFCIRYCYVTVLLAIGFILAYVCADTLRMLITGLIDGDYVCGLPVLMNEMSHANTQPFDFMLLIFELGAFFFGHSIFVLGGVVFRRFQFLLTFSCFMAFIVLLAVLPIDDVLDRLDKSGTTTGYVALIVFYLLAAFNYWYAYILFRKRLSRLTHRDE